RCTTSASSGRAASTRLRSRRSRARSPTDCARRSRAMANSTLVENDSAALEKELAGLDALAAALPARTSRLHKLWSSVWPPLAATVIFVFLWQVVVWTGWKSEELLPSPFTVLQSLKDNISVIWGASLTTLYRGVKGFLLAVVIGTVIGVITARSKVVRTA